MVVCAESCQIGQSVIPRVAVNVVNLDPWLLANAACVTIG